MSCKTKKTTGAGELGTASQEQSSQRVFKVLPTRQEEAERGRLSEVGY